MTSSRANKETIQVNYLKYVKTISYCNPKFSPLTSII